jgi:hypothetical protein
MAKLAELAIGQEWACISPVSKSDYVQAEKVIIVELEPYISLGTFRFEKKFRLRSEDKKNAYAWQTHRGPTFVKVHKVNRFNGSLTEDYALLGYLQQSWADYEAERKSLADNRKKQDERERERRVHNQTVVQPKREQLKMLLEKHGNVSFYDALNGLNEKQIDVMLNALMVTR